MIRSLLSITAAVIVGLMAARLIERIGATLLVKEQAEALTPVYFGVLIVSWGVSAFAASLTALLSGGRWAPLGFLGAATMGLNAIMAMLGATPPWWAWPAGLAVTALGGYAAMLLTQASMVHPDKDPSDKGRLFS